VLLIFWKLLGMLPSILEYTAGIVVLVALYFWENKKEEKQITQISRNETLSRLPVRLSTNRIIELVQLRDITRPVILAGSKASVTRAMQRAERYRTELLKRGVLLIPVIFGASQKDQTKPRGFGTRRAAASAPSVGVRPALHISILAKYLKLHFTCLFSLCILYEKLCPFL